MASNPLYQANLGANNATAPTNPVNEAEKPLKRRYNRFPLSHKFLNTLRYGEISPFFVLEGVEGDKIPFSSRHEIRSYTLSAPMMSDIRMNKDYFLVPMQAILPFNWEKIYVNPTQGDDVPDNANCVWSNFYGVLGNGLDTGLQIYNSFKSDPTDLQTLGQLLRGAIFYEVLFSDGSLLSTLGCKYGHLLSATQNGKKISLDKWCEMLYKHLINESIRVQFHGDTNTYVVNPEFRTDNSVYVVSRHTLLEMMRENPDFKVLACTPSSPEVAPLPESFLVRFTPADLNGSPVMPVNLSRLIAYQIACAHFYTNDKVDYLYSADLWRQNMLSLANNVFIAGSDTSTNHQVRFFEYNGVPTMYDVMSGYYLDEILGGCLRWCWSRTDFEQGNSISGLHYAINLFGYQRSLRYGDYFTGSKPSPLAVGDVNAPVVASGVSALDMTKNIMMQRFLNSVNRVGRKFSEYVTEVMGGAPAPSATDPKFLAHNVSSVGGFEVENTAENQGNITTLLRASDNNYAFEVSVEQPCIILGLVSFDVARIYSKVTSKFFQKVDRFDMFNPYMQYIGDQPVDRKELGIRYFNNANTPFAYTLRHMEYKQGVHTCAGGFVENLPAWAFITDNGTSGAEEIPHMKIDPEYIRSRSSELDRFYASLTGDTLASYFHFIVKFDNVCEPARQMDYAPSIL